MKLSRFGEKFTSNSGILQLMDDLGNALAGDKDMIMMGGGNPSHIPEVQALFRKRLHHILQDEDQFKRLIGTYDPPQGEKEFISALASMFRKEFGWKIQDKNIGLTNGSQSAFFLLFNMFAGEFSDGSIKKIQLPLAPEYIGYTDVGLIDDFFVAGRPHIEYLDEHTFKYHVNFDEISITDQTGAICASRPANPSGNVLTDDEVEKLHALSKEHDIPLIIDNAYGAPFPDIIFTDANPIWNDKIIFCMSLSKLGLPAARTGIVIAHEKYIKSLSGMNAIINLAPGSFGSMLAMDLVNSGEIISLSRDIIKPYYKNKALKAVEYLKKELTGCNYYIHKPEGAIFLWLWFKDLPITSMDLYERLKQRGVLVMSGHYFFPGIQEDWQHKYECIRITYSQGKKDVRKGVQIIAEEIKKAYSA